MGPALSRGARSRLPNRGARIARDLLGHPTPYRTQLGRHFLHPPELAALYTQACEKRVEAMENDLLEIADDTARDYREGKNGQEIPNKEVVLRSKIRIESRQRLMSRRDPQQ